MTQTTATGPTLGCMEARGADGRGRGQHGNAHEFELWQHPQGTLVMAASERVQCTHGSCALRKVDGGDFCPIHEAEKKNGE